MRRLGDRYHRRLDGDEHQSAVRAGRLKNVRIVSEGPASLVGVGPFCSMRSEKPLAAGATLST
jgi:hypothetical protein